MKKLIKRGGNFVRNNPTIIYSLLLIFVVVGALFLNSYVILSRFQNNIDKTLRTKAVLAENIVGIAALGSFSYLTANTQQLQDKITEIQKSDSEIAEMTVYALGSGQDEFIPIVSSRNDENEQISDPLAEQITKKAKQLALSMDDAFAYISAYNGNRFWNVVKAARDENGKAQGILFLKLSLAENDALVEKTITQVYLLSIGAMIIVLLLVLNHIRLFAFEIKAKKLEEVDKMKDDFLSMASHELKSPLAAISGYSDLLSDMFKNNQTETDLVAQRKYLKNINISVDRLKTLVDDLLNVSRIEQNRLPIACTSIDAKEITIGIMNEMQAVADQKGLMLKNSLTSVSLALADPERVKQIIMNLISNAIKYTAKGTVEITSREDVNSIYITVIDTGFGISADNMKNLFSKFYRVKTADTEKIAGTGLGLWISREIARKMDGDIEVESIESVGSHFTLKLKKAK